MNYIKWGKQKEGIKMKFFEFLICCILVFSLISVIKFKQIKVFASTNTKTSSPTITLSKNSSAISETINVTISGANNPTHNKDWIGLYEKDATPDGNPVAIWWDYLPSLGITNGSGTFTFDPANIPSKQKGRYAEGKRYKFILAYDDTYNIEANVSFDVLNPTLSLSNTTVDLYEPIEITLSNAVNPSHSKDWIGLYEENETPDGNPKAIWWDYLPNIGITTGSGIFTFDPAQIPNEQKGRYISGKRYKFVLAYNDTYNIKASENFIVNSINWNKIPHNKMTATATGEATSHGDIATNAIDDNNSTIWHTKWDGSDQLPQSITLSLGKIYDIYEVRYLPRQSIVKNGIIMKYKLYTSVDGINFTQVAKGDWVADKSEKIVRFVPVEATYVKLEAEHGVNGFACAAEINVYTKDEVYGDIISLKNVILNTQIGVAPQLPDVIIASYNTGNTSEVNVTWDNIDEAQYAKLGSFTVQGTVKGTTLKAKANITVIEGDGPLFNFQVISDVHINGTDMNAEPNRQFTNALKDIHENTPNSSGLMIDGDLTENGYGNQYDGLNNVLNANPHPDTYFAIGNHDIRWLAGGYNEGKNRFLDKTGMPGIYYDQWIEGYHFIFLGTEQALKDDSYISDTQFEWLEQKLAEDADANKPIFVFLHQPMKDTVAGSDKWYGVVQDQRLKDTLAQYPQVIYFSGHSHYHLRSANTMYNEQYCTMFNTASVHQLWDGVTDSLIVNGSQGLYLDVYPNKVVVKGKDFYNKEWIPELQITIEFPVSIPPQN